MNATERQALDKWIIYGPDKRDPRYQSRDTTRYKSVLASIKRPFAEYLQGLIFDKMPRQGVLQRLPATDQEFEKRCKRARLFAGKSVTDAEWEQAKQAVSTRLTATQTRIAQMHACAIRRYYLKCVRNRDTRKFQIIADEAWQALTKSYDRDDARLKAQALDIFIKTLAY